jgi:hypothetical protein
MFLPLIVAISSLPSWWWTRGPGLPDPPPFLTRVLVAIAAVGGGLVSSYLLGNGDVVTSSIAAFAGGRVLGGVATMLNPQPLPPKA